MKVRRKYSLDRVNLRYETVDIEIIGESMDDVAKRIDLEFNRYCKLIMEKKIL